MYIVSFDDENGLPGFDDYVFDTVRGAMKCASQLKRLGCQFVAVYKNVPSRLCNVTKLYSYTVA